jgi:hypothetical protein
MNFMDLFGGGKNPANSAMQYLNQIPGMEKGYLNPFIEKGAKSGDILSDKYGSLTNDPGAFLEQLMKGYAPSKSYQMNRDEQLRSAGNTAAAGGMRGSQGDIENSAKITDTLMGKDMQDWLGNVTGLFNTGLKGEQGLFNTGYDASKDLSSDLANLMGTQAQTAFQGQREQNQRGGDMLSMLMHAFGGAAGLPINFSKD